MYVVLVAVAFELVSHHRPNLENISLCISFCAFVLCLILYFIYFIFVLAMFDISLQKRGENIATLPVYIFVFVNEVLNKIIEEFQ